MTRNTNPKNRMNHDANRIKTGPKNWFISYYIIFILNHFISYASVADSQSISCFMAWLRILIFPWADYWKVLRTSSLLKINILERHLNSLRAFLSECDLHSKDSSVWYKNWKTQKLMEICQCQHNIQITKKFINTKEGSG